MARTNVNSALHGLHGRIDEWVYKHYKYGTVVTRRPRMAHVTWSPAQRAHREAVRESGKFYRDVKANPALRAKYQAVADARGIPLSAVTLEEFMRRRKGRGQSR